MFTLIKQEYKKHKKLKYLIIVCACLVFLFRVWLWNAYRDEDYGNGNVTKRRTEMIHEPKRSSKNIFFLEMSCVGGTKSGGSIGPHQACAVECAARTNQDHSVYLLHTCAFDRNDLPDYASRLMLFPNVRFLRIEPGHFVGGWRGGGPPLELTGDVLRLVTLWKYGGTSVDLDFLLLKSLNGLANFVGAESNLSLTKGIMNFEPYGVGHDIVTDCLKEAERFQDGSEWAVTRVLHRRCAGSQTAEKRKALCGDFSVLTPNTVSPIAWSAWPVYRVFNNPVANITLDAIGRSFAVRAWDNRFSDSHSTFTLLAKRYCPAVFNLE